MKGHLSPYRRELIHKCMDGIIDQKILTFLHFVQLHRQADQIYEWLIANRITGMNLINKLAVDHQHMQSTLVQQAISYIEKNPIRPLEFGRDVIP